MTRRGFFHRGFKTYGHRVDEGALVRLLDVAEDLPYSVQRIAYVAWELLRVEPHAPLLPGKSSNER